MRVLQEIWQPWYRLLHPRQVSPVITMFEHTTFERPKAIKKLLTQLKYTMLRTIEPLAMNYVATRITQTGWPGTIPFLWIERIAKAPKRLVNGIARYALLRWAFGEDDDLGLYLRIHTGHQQESARNVLKPPVRIHPVFIRNLYAKSVLRQHN